MPIQSLRTPPFKPPRDVIVSWESWRKGWNTLLRENELDGAEMASSTNLLLRGSGIPSKRWGSQNYFTAGATGSARFTIPIKDTSDNIDVLAFTDWGFMTKKNGASYTLLTGASWPSGSTIDGAQLGSNVYLVSANREMVRYDFSTLKNFATLTTPTGVAVSNMSSATGSTTYSWRITAVGKSGGETIASTSVSMPTLPQDLAQTVMRVQWTAVSAASGDLTGYNVYRGAPGDERWIGGVDDATTVFYDTGTATSDPFRVVPTSNTTGGPKAKYIIRYQDRLILAGIPGEPTKVLISGRYPDQERFDWYAGGGFIDIEPDSGQNITGLGIYQEKIVVFKENSVWQLLLNQVQFGNYLILDPQYKLLTASQGCTSHKSIVPVENDLMFANRKGVYILRYEPQLQNILNANEISAKIRPFFESLTDDDHTSSAGVYIDKKYVLSFPNSKQSICFDRERLCFTGPWITPFGINHWSKYIDATGMERWIAADSTDNIITEFSKNYLDDKGTAIRTIFKSKKEDFDDWTIFKTINEVYFNFRAVTGSVEVNIYIEERSGNVVAAKSFTLSSTGSSGSSGFGTDQLGLVKFGLSLNVPSQTASEIQRKTFIYKSSRTFQVEVRTTGLTDNFELLGIKTIAIPQARGNSPSAWNTN